MSLGIQITMKDQKSFEVIVQDCPSEKDKMVDKLLQRSEARVAELEKKKSEKDVRSSIYEQTDYFNETFNQKKLEIELKLQNADKVDKEYLAEYFDEMVRDLQDLQKFLADSTLFLCTYDIKKAQEALKNFQDDIQAAESNLIPKKKFSFKSKKKIFEHPFVTNGVHKFPVREIITPLPSDSISMIKLYKCGFKDMSNQKLFKQRHEIEKQDVGLHKLQNCTVHLYGAASTIFISGLTDCQIFAGPVSTSVFVENCIRCTFVFACQQLRVHSCRDSLFYLHVTSRTIIEDSKGLSFAPYNWVYDGQDRDFIIAGLSKENNNWDSIDDFNWLVIGTPSPNWTFLEKDKYQTWI